MAVDTRATGVLRAYLLAFAAVGLSTCLRWPLDSVLGTDLPFLLFFPAIMVAAWYGGAGPGLVATLGSALSATVFLLHPTGDVMVHGVRDVVGLTTFTLIGIQISFLCDGLIRARRRADDTGERLAVTLRSIGDAVLTTDATGRVTFLNPVAEKLTGWTTAEARGRTLAEVFVVRSESTDAPVEDPVLEVLREGRIVGLANHAVLIAKDGRRTSIADSAAPIRDEDRELRGVVLVFRDVSEERRAQERERAGLARERAARAELETIVRQLPVGVVVADPTGRFVHANEHLERVTGVAAPDTTAGIASYAQFQLVRPDGTRYPPEKLPLARALRDGERVSEELLSIRPDGVRVPLQVDAAPVRDEDGKLIAGVVTFADLTETKRGEEARRRWNDVFQHAGWSVALLDGKTTRILAANPAFARLHGRKVDELVGTELEELVAPEAREPLARNLATVDERGDHVYECVHRRADGTTLPCMVQASAFRDASGKIVYRAATFQDLTELKRAEESLREADRRKTEFLAMLAHELRNPLAPIRTSIELLRLQGPKDPKLDRYREVIERQVVHLGRLVDDLLDVSRITRGTINLTKERVDLDTIVARALETSRPLIEGRGHSLQVALPDEPIYVEADPLRLAQVVSNLLDNAAKYTDPGGHVRLVVERERDQGVIRVRDDGMGISAQTLPHVFELFSQGERALDRSQGGLGIGLTIVRTLVEMHGGTVSVTSDGPGRGSEFVVRLPALPPARARPRGETLAPATRSRRILVVDDNPDALESMADLLRVLGHEVETAASGPEALEKTPGFHPEIVLLDLGLPGLDGFEVARRMRELDGTTMKIIAVTGYGQEEDRRRTAESGFDGHLTKPVEPLALERAIGQS